MNRDSLELAKAIEKGVTNALKNTALKVSVKKEQKGISMIEMARALKRHCAEHMCYQCEFDGGDTGCPLISTRAPENWEV